MIRRATHNELDVCVELAIEFFKPFLFNHGVPVIVQDVKNIAEMSILAGQVLVVEHDKKVQGLTAWAVVPHPANHNIKIFYETIWCVKSRFKTDTLLLLRELEREAVIANADLILMANLSTDHEAQLKRIYLKRGFQFLETHYSKQIRRD